MNLFKRRVPIVLQIEVAECGAASLCMILGYYKRFIDMTTMRKDCKISRDGSRLSFMMNAAKKHGLEPHAFRKSAEELVNETEPFIVFWNYNHFLVVESINEKYAYLCNPSSGRVRVTFDEFKQSYTGVMCSFKKTKDFIPMGKPFNLLSAILSITGKSMGTFIYIALTYIIFNLTSILIPGFTRLFVDDYLPDAGIINPLPLFSIFVITLLLQMGILVLQKTYLLRFEKRMSSITSSNTIRKSLRLPVSYFNTRSRSALVSKIDSTDNVCGFISSQFVPMCIGMIFSIIYLLILFYTDFILASIIFVLTISVVFIVNYILKASADSIQHATNSSQKFYGIIVQTVKLFDSMKATASEDSSFEEISSNFNEYQNAGQHSQILASYASALPSTIPSLFQVIILGIGGYRVMSGELSLGGLLSFQSLSLAFFSPLTQLIGQITQFQSLTANVKGVLDILNEKSDPISVRDEETKYIDTQIDKAEKNTDLPAAENKMEEDYHKNLKSISVSDISFGYNPALPPVIDHISFDIPPGKTIAIAGTSGSGKSTILKILEGLYLPTEGNILFDNIPLIETDREIFASSVGIVPQVPCLFNASVRDNITMFNKDISEAEIIRACQDACIHDDITVLPERYNTLLVNSGSKLSGGQRQRLMIARALVKNPSIIIMDEATSALDALVEEQVMNNIKKRNTTLIIVAHRLSTIRDADEILILDKGKIAERGTHEELMSENASIYKELVLSENTQQ